MGSMKASSALSKTNDSSSESWSMVRQAKGKHGWFNFASWKHGLESNFASQTEESGGLSDFASQTVGPSLCASKPRAEHEWCASQVEDWEYKT